MLQSFGIRSSGTLQVKIVRSIPPAVPCFAPVRQQTSLRVKRLTCLPSASGVTVPAPATPELTEWIDQNEIRTSEFGLAFFDGGGPPVQALWVD